MFQRRHYEFIAATIKAMPTHAASLRTQRESCARSFCEALDTEGRQSGVNFKPERFLKACGVE